MATEHKNIPDAERHEPKGVSAASVGQVYRSNGSASGAWKDDLLSLSGVLDDVSNPSAVLIPLPANCVVVSMKFVLGGAITLANSNLTITRGGDAAVVGTAVVNFTGSAEGAVVNVTPSGNATLTASTHNYLKIATDGASTTTAKLFISVKVKVIE